MNDIDNFWLMRKKLSALKHHLDMIGVYSQLLVPETGPEYLMEIFNPIEGQRDLWLMSDMGLTPAIHKAARTARLAKIDLDDLEGAVDIISSLLKEDK